MHCTQTQLSVKYKTTTCQCQGDSEAMTVAFEDSRRLKSVASKTVEIPTIRQLHAIRLRLDTTHNTYIYIYIYRAGELSQMAHHSLNWRLSRRRRRRRQLRHDSSLYNACVCNAINSTPDSIQLHHLTCCLKRTISTNHQVIT